MMLFDTSEYQSISLKKQIELEEIEKKEKEYVDNLFSKKTKKKVGRPKGKKNRISRGSFYKRGVSKKGVEQWSFHFHKIVNGVTKKSSVSVPFELLLEAKKIAFSGGILKVLQFLGKPTTGFAV